MSPLDLVFLSLAVFIIALAMLVTVVSIGCCHCNRLMKRTTHDEGFWQPQQVVEGENDSNSNRLLN